jgi:hypothetical protein
MSTQNRVITLGFYGKLAKFLPASVEFENYSLGITVLGRSRYYGLKIAQGS